MFGIPNEKCFVVVEMIHYITCKLRFLDMVYNFWHVELHRKVWTKLMILNLFCRRVFPNIIHCISKGRPLVFVSRKFRRSSLIHVLISEKATGDSKTAMHCRFYTSFQRSFLAPYCQDFCGKQLNIEFSDILKRSLHGV